VPSSYLITGGAGFIGSHLADRLIARGDRVTCLDDLSTGSLSNLVGLVGHQHFTFLEGSVLDADLVDAAVSGADVVVHLAAAVGVRLIVDQPLRSFTTNIDGSHIVIDASHRHARRILVASTSEIYGKNEQVPLGEDAERLLGNTTVARWAYSTAKAVDEILAFAYHRERGLAAIVVRLFNTVGPRQSPTYGMVLPRLARQAVANEPLTVFGNGRQTRCFCHVADVVGAIVRLLETPAAVGGVFNVGSEEEVSILDLARRLGNAAGSTSSITLIPYDDVYGSGFEDMQRRVPDISRVRELTGWRPSRDLDRILSEAVVEARSELARRATSPPPSPSPP